VSDKESVKLHTAENRRIWYLAGEGGPLSTGKTLDQFLQEAVLLHGTIVRILGVPQNAALIAALYVRKKELSIQRIELAGPQVCDRAVELTNPDTTLFRMRQCLLTASQGGWHVMTDRDYPAYHHSAAWQVAAWELASQGPAHLLKPAMSFIVDLNVQAACALFAEWLDPRWHVDPSAIERGGRLKAFLGLLPARSGAAAERAKMLRAMWWKSPSPEDLDRPGHFIWRTYKKSGFLKADQRLATYLRHSWMDALFPGNGFFDPRKFFVTPDEIDAYNAHMSTARGSV
jgi:hypothetical protein